MWRKIIFLLLSASLSFSAFSQKYNFENFSTENGLSQASGATFLQDNQGFLWIGTYDGLNRFDGRTFEKFYRNHEDESSLLNNSITDLDYDSSGYIWIGTNSGLTRYNLKLGRFESTPISRSLTNILNLYRDNNQDLWVVRDNQISIISDYNKVKSTIDVAAKVVIQVEDYKYWIGTNEGLFSYDTKMGLSTPILVDHNIHEFEYKDNTYWIATDKGLYKANNIDHKLIPVKGLQNKNCKAIEFDQDGNLWIASDDITILNVENLSITSISMNNGETYPSSNIQTIFKDMDGGMWIGTDGFGINYYNPVKVHLTHLNYLTYDKNSLPSPFVKSIYESDEGVVWIGTSNGLSMYNPHTKRYTNYSTSDGLPSNQVNTIVKWNKQILFGTNHGVSVKTTKRFITTFPFLNGQEISSFLALENHLWIGTANSLYKVSAMTSVPEIIIDTEHKVTALKMDSLGNLWCGTDNGLLKIVNDSIFNKYEYNDKDPRSLYNSFIKSIEIDTKGRIWVGTKEGLSMYHPKTDDFTTITKKNGLPNDLIYGILSQRNGKLWMSTNNGLCQYDPDSLIFRKFTSDDNLQSNEFNSGAYHKGNSGFMYFGGINGLNIFHPGKITQKLGSPLTTITGIDLFHEPIPIKTDGILREHASYVDTIRLTHKQNNLTIRFTSINFVNPKNSHYRYKLSNLNTRWVETSLPVAEFTNLNPGTYQFSAASAGRDNDWSDIDHPITIIITPPLWQVLWFQMLVGITMFIIIYMIYRWRIRQFKIQQLKLEYLVQERTEEIAAQNEELHSQSDAIMESNDLLNEQKEELNSLNNDLERKVKDRTESLSEANTDLNKALSELDMFIYRSSHDLRGPVASLLGLTSILQMKGSKQEMLDISNKIAITTENLNTTLDKLLTINVINREAKDSTSIPLKSFINDAGKFYMGNDKFDIGKLTVSIPDDLHINTDHELFQIILDQLFINAITFNNGNAVDISIEIEVGDYQYQLSFEDSGQGISEDIKDKVYQMFYRGSDKSKGNGLGLYVVKKAMDKLGGNISFTSIVDQGTTFTLLFPYRHN